MSSTSSMAFPSLRPAVTSLLLCFAASVPISAAIDEAVNWRVWNSDDGMLEAYITQVSRAPNGRIFVRNGDVPRLSVIDGFRLWKVPEIDSLSRILADSTGDLYAFNRAGIQRFEKGSWQKYPWEALSSFTHFGIFEHYGWFDYPNATDTESRVGVVMSGVGKMLFSFPDRLVEWSLGGSVKVVRRSADCGIGEFVDISVAQNGGYFVSGQHGLALLSKDMANWREFPTGGFVRFVNPLLMQDGRIMATAGAGGQSKQLIVSSGSGWNVLYRGDKKLKGWETSDGRIWAMEEQRLLSVRPHRVKEVNLRPWLTGRLLDAMPDGDSFWLGTMQGLARYSPPLWQVPDSVPEIGETVNSIAQDAMGRLWFASGEKIFSFNRGEWRSYRLPNGLHQDAGKTGSICPQDNGRILLLAQDVSYLLELNPETGSFRVIPHPEGRLIKWVERRNGSSIWLQSLNPDERASRIEIFDGSGFRVLPGAGAVPTTDIRSLLTTRDGAVWTGGTGAIVRIKDGLMHAFGKKDGLGEISAFSMVQGADGTLFVGHRDALSSFDGRRFHVLRRGMDRIRRLAISRNGALWAASGTGIHRLVNGNWITNGVEEGLPANPAYTVFEDRDGAIWTGTTLGLAVFRPGSDREAPVTTIHEDQNLRQSPPGGEVRFAFSGIDRWKQTLESRLLFSWRLDGGQWTPFEKSALASVRSLPSGPHVFEVRAMDRNGNIDSHPARFAFAVLFPWYRETGFYFIAAVLVLALGSLLRIGYNYHGDLRFQSRHDALTGLPNRLQFEEALSVTVESPRNFKSPAAVLFIDLDGFKSVNDALGHAAGDKVLTDVGRELKGALGKGDLLARLGGDEFAILLTSAVGRDAVARFADSILEVVRRCSPSLALPISGSVGISLYPEHADSACVLVRLADLAMYQSKSCSGDCRLFYDPSMKVDFRTAEVSGMIRAALRDNNLVLWYQPVTDRERRVVHMECLVRIDDPSSGIVAPGIFIGVAEETGLIHDIGSWVLREGLRTAREWRDGGNPVPVAVNISPVQLENPALAGEILSLLAHYGLDPSVLTVEITEGAIIKNRNRAVEILSSLRAAGVRISLDDFGTGYSSLSMLDGMPLDEIKLDRSFAQSIGGERTRDVICQTVSLARKLNATIVAEGIEETAQMNAALELGCDLFQGYLIAPPLEKQTATQFITSQQTLNDLHALARG